MSTFLPSFYYKKLPYAQDDESSWSTAVTIKASNAMATEQAKDDVRRFLMDAQRALSPGDYANLFDIVQSWLTRGNEIVGQSLRTAMGNLLQGSNQDRENIQSLLTGLTTFLTNLGIILPPGRLQRVRFSDLEWLQDLLPASMNLLVPGAHPGQSPPSSISGESSDHAPAAAPRPGMESGNEEPDLAADHSLISKSTIGNASGGAYSSSTVDMNTFGTDDSTDEFRPLDPNLSVDSQGQQHGEADVDASRMLQALGVGNLLSFLASSEADRGAVAGEEESKEQQRCDDVHDSDGEPDVKRARR